MGTWELLRKDFKGAVMPGRCRGKEQSVQGYGPGWKIWSKGEEGDRGEWSIRGEEKAGISVSCDCPHLGDGPSEGGWA